MITRGLGDTSSCGDNPCTWWDAIWQTNPCIEYQCCVDPTSLTCTMASGSFQPRPAGTGPGGLFNTAGSQFVQGITAPFQGFSAGLLTQLGVDPAAAASMSGILGVGIAALVVIIGLKLGGVIK